MFYNSKTVHKEDNVYKERESTDYEESGEIFWISSFNNTFFIADSGNIVYDYDYAQGRGQQRNFNEFHDEDIFRSVPKPVITFGFWFDIVFVIVLILNYG